MQRIFTAFTGLLLASAAAGQVPLVVEADGAAELALEVRLDGAEICTLTGPDATCVISDWPDLGDLSISGAVDGAEVTRSWRLLDISEWTAPLHDGALDLGAKLDAFAANSTALHAAVSPRPEGRFFPAPVFEVETVEEAVPPAETLPAPLTAFATRAVSFDEMTWYAGAHPNVRGWPSVTEFYASEGAADEDIPSGLRDWSDAATVVYIDQRRDWSLLIWHPEPAPHGTWSWLLSEYDEPFEIGPRETDEAVERLLLAPLGLRHNANWVTMAALAAGLELAEIEEAPPLVVDRLAPDTTFRLAVGEELQLSFE
ncbi:hypothetical protein [Pontivivens ytuae]|uniref:Uncharacterized protein n=1 Tax=Pontivivens ytuae TaxID=2789856 RepID=A0A7S9LSE7_9RHOB|nr:hypothetical protein [Pontivivens ytuae]QPH54281.1 hypothetical protein I0K15_00435 [Pontivivens ytuae]